MTRLVRLGASMVILGAVTALPVWAAEGPLDRLVAAYPDYLVGHDDVSITWKDGTVMAATDGRSGRSYEEKLGSPTLLDQMEMVYRPGPMGAPPGPNEDPGRFRFAPFFDKMYGDCDKGEVARKLVAVKWPGGGTVRITSVNGVADRLKAISEEIGRLPDAIRRAAYPSAGTYNCRVVKDTGNRSAHAWGAAIDVNVKYSDYWLWSKGKYRNRIPMEIVEIFERHGFIWGGKWGHFDTMHFEYRPELLP